MNSCLRRVVLSFCWRPRCVLIRKIEHLVKQRLEYGLRRDFPEMTSFLPCFFLQSKVLLVMKPTLLFLCCLSKKHKLVSQQRSWSRGKLRDAKRVNERMQLNTCIFCANSFLKQETKGNCQETAAVVFIHYAYLHECQDRIWIKFRNCLAGDWVCLRVPFSAVSFSVVTWITSFTRRGLYFSWCRLI